MSSIRLGVDSTLTKAARDFLNAQLDPDSEEALVNHPSSPLVEAVSLRLVESVPRSELLPSVVDTVSSLRHHASNRID